MSIHWQVVGQSVRGAAHERNGLPNQDAIYWLPSAGRGSSVVLTAADGHGSARYPRSHIGAALAVENAAELVNEFIDSQNDVSNLSLIKHATEEWLPRALVRNWSEAVAEHLTKDPLPAEEVSALAAGPTVAYGATLLIAAVTERFVMYLQLGDGE